MKKRVCGSACLCQRHTYMYDLALALLTHSAYWDGTWCEDSLGHVGPVHVLIVWVTSLSLINIVMLEITDLWTRHSGSGTACWIYCKMPYIIYRTRTACSVCVYIYVTTRMTSALRWVGMRTIFMFYWELKQIWTEVPSPLLISLMPYH